MKLLLGLVLPTLAFSQSIARFNETVAKAPQTIAQDYRLRAAQAIAQHDPALARKIALAALPDLGDPSPATLQALIEIAPAETLPALPKLGPNATQMAITLLARADRMDDAVALLRKTVAAIHDPLSPRDALLFATIPLDVAKAVPEFAADCYERALKAAPSPNVIAIASTRLRAIAPHRAEKYKDLAASSKPEAAPQPPEIASISKRMSSMRGLPTDHDRSELAKALALEIRTADVPPARKLALIQSLANVSTEGDLGKETLGAVATTLALALRGFPTPEGYLELAKLVRYERLTVPTDPSLDAAESLLALREAVQQESGFTLTSLEGKQYTLAGLRGKIVLLNFWATWCPPCRKEMPDMEKLYRKYADRGLTVIAVSDEDRETVTKFLEKNRYTFPIALDPGRKVNTTFSVEGIPKSFIFDREGRLAAQAIDMRTESQFMELLKQAGLE